MPWERSPARPQARHRLLPRDRLRYCIAVQQYRQNGVAAQDRQITVPEVDRAEWCDLETARSKILSVQVDLIGRLKMATNGYN
jgi:hypothetical protein